MDSKKATNDDHARHAYERFEFFTDGLDSGDQNPSDGLTKETDNGALNNLFTMGMEKTTANLQIDRTQLETL